MSRYEIFEGSKKGSWYYKLVGDNGEILGGSEAYTRKEDAVRGAGDAQNAAQYARIVDEGAD